MMSTNFNERKVNLKDWNVSNLTLSKILTNLINQYGSESVRNEIEKVTK